MFKRSRIGVAVVLAVGSLASASVLAQGQTVEVTGSRVKRAQAEGALPVQVITRAELEASGQNTVAEFVRSLAVMTSGNFRPQSGSSAQAFAEVNLRGLGSRRTLVLIDGRRIAKSPIVGDAVNMNSIPMAAVERIEILTDGASAVYGSDAIGGVVNIILRKDFEGGAFSYGETKTSNEGGDRKEASALLGVRGDKGSMLLGASMTSREIIYVRDYPWGAAVGASSYANNYARAPGFGSGGAVIGAVPGGCTGPGFYTTNRCRYDFNLVAADEAATDNRSVFAQGEAKINNDWSAFLAVSATRSTSFGRYAPVPGDIKIEPGSRAHPWSATFPDLSPTGLRSKIGANETVYIAHRFAAGGNRDTNTTEDMYDAMLSVKGKVLGADVEMGARSSRASYNEVGRGYVIETLARLAILEGRYNVFDPFSATQSALQSFTTTVGRDSKFNSADLFANATFDVFKLGGGTARIFANVEQRKEIYADIYDSLSEAGVVLGSAGNSAGGERKVSAASAELVMPVTKELEATLAARYEKYSDYGSDFSPKFSVRFQPLKTLTLRGSMGKGFSAPTLPQLTQKPAYSADDAIDLKHCIADGQFTAAQCAADKPTFQINGLSISNPSLSSEKSTQFSFGAAWDVTPMLTAKVDYWNTKIDGLISNLTAQDIIDRNNGSDPRAIPPGLSIKRDPITGSIQQVIRGATNEGLLKISGLDLQVNFGSYSLGGFGKLSHELKWSHVMTNTTDGVNTNGIFESPKDRGSLRTSWNMGPFDATWSIQVIGKHGDDDVGRVKQYVTHDLAFGYNTPIKGAKITIGAVNVEGKLPELITNGAKPFSYNLYDAYGAQVYARLNVKF